MTLKVLNLKKHPTINEKWVQEEIANDPSILGLGELIVRDKERIQSGAGRLDLLLQDPETLKRYEVEIQLGSVDESHIIRTVEYWDIERKRYPQYEHAAVIVAEEITSRFLNVIQLFNGAIPLIALKMTAYEVEGKTYLTFVKIIDEISYGLVGEDEPVDEPTDRAYWEKKGSKKSLEIADNLMKIVNQVEPLATHSYKKHYIGMTVNNAPYNFMSFKLRKNDLITQFKIKRNPEADQLIEDIGFNTLPYDAGWKLYRIRVGSGATEAEKEAILTLTKMAHDEFSK